jgi:phosphoglycolate phosphatase
MAPSRIETVIFDLDGTLVDSMPGIEYAAENAWAAVWPGPACPSLRPLIGPPIREMFRRALPDAEAAILDALELAFRASYDTDGWRKTAVYPGVIETLARLTEWGVRCFGVTNKPSLPTQRILDHCGLRCYFGVFLSPDARVPRFASKAEAVAALLAEYALDRERTVLMGDTADDARAAAACGLRFVAFAGGYGAAGQAPELEADWPCADFTDLLAIVRGETV